jgi:hypothetical protein
MFNSTQSRAAERPGSDSPPSIRVVEATSDGRWRVRVPGSQRASAVLETRSEAEARAREILRRSGGGELRICSGMGEPISSLVAAACAIPGRRQLTRQPRG